MKLLIFLFLTLSTSLFSQNKEEAEIKTAVNTLFDAMREVDSTKLRSVIHKDIRLQTIGKKKTGEAFLFEEKVDDFVKAVGTPHEEIWNEVIHSFDIKLDGSLATVWAPYTFYLGDKLSHCGVNAFQLIKVESAWKIISIIDTRRKDNCSQKK